MNMELSREQVQTRYVKRPTRETSKPRFDGLPRDMILTVLSDSWRSSCQRSRFRHICYFRCLSRYRATNKHGQSGRCRTTDWPRLQA
jgi:hypothetical protein